MRTVMKRANLWLSLISFCLLALEPCSATPTSRDNDSGSSGPSVALTRQAITLGMEPAALGELWRTKQPVLVSKTDEQGQLYTTTYELSPDGQHISSKVVKEEPQLSSTTTTTPSPPAPSAASAAPSGMPQPTNPQTDWEYVPSNMGNRRTFTLPSNWPDFGSRLPQFPSFDFPPGVTPQTSTKTSQDDQGRTVTTTTKTYKGPIGSGWPTTGTSLGANWPSFEFPAGVTPQTTSKTEQDDQGRTVTTLTRTYKSPVFTTWSTGAEPTFSQGLPPWFKNTNPFADEVPSLTPSSAQPYPVQPAVSSMPPLPTPPPVGTPRTELDELPPATRRVTSYSSSFNGGATPKTADLDPQLRYLLDRGGFTDEDIQNAQALGRDLVRTRVLPDGRTIRTTLRVIKSPVRAPPAYTPLPTAPVSHTQPEVPPLCQAQPGSQILPGDNPIDNFLSQVQLTSDDIQAQNGELVKTIVDQYGRVLSAKFVLSTVKGEGQGQGQQEQPTK